MAFVFDATISGLTSNSYISLSDANDYFAGRTKSDNWINADDATKQASLVQATRRINSEMYSGLPSIMEQSLAWPRKLLIDLNGLYIPSTVMPRTLSEATCEMALYYLDSDDRLLDDNEMENFTSYEVGPLKLQTRWWNRDQLPSRVNSLLLAIGPGAWLGPNASRISSMAR
jgi:hypothetical protein